jgi:transposase
VSLSNHYTPDVRFERTTILSSIRTNGELVPLVFEGSLNGELFKEYISQYFDRRLLSAVEVWSVSLSNLLSNRLSSHKVKGVIDPIIAVGATVLYLPPYSPDLNPIEMILRQAQ